MDLKAPIIRNAMSYPMQPHWLAKVCLCFKSLLVRMPQSVHANKPWSCVICMSLAVLAPHSAVVLTLGGMHIQQRMTVGNSQGR